MLILRGISGDFALNGVMRHWPNGALDEPSAVEYARRRRFVGQLDVSGEAYDNSPQVLMCLDEFRKDPSVAALYGFSGGGYNVRHVIDHMTDAEKQRIKLVVVLGAPINPESLYRQGSWELVYRTDPPDGHMQGPLALLNELTTTPIIA